MGADLDAHKEILFHKLSELTTVSQESENQSPPLWNISSLEGIQFSCGFAEEHISSLTWIQECLIYHQKTLVRARNLTRANLDSISRASYMRNRHRDLVEIVGGKPSEIGGAASSGSFHLAFIGLFTSFVLVCHLNSRCAIVFL
ncbi:hypothetical protein NMY22_g9035 [Coprinellus aureogranulatus]|nr:hypothetical protein NMY22_g9035 [Coprinellus aureogranulatus]